MDLSGLGEHLVNPSDRNIPVHLLGNMWAQSWANLYERIKPFKASDLDITAALKRNNYTALKIFQEADRFYESLGLPSSKMSYTKPSIIQKPNDREIVCHASAWVCTLIVISCSLTLKNAERSETLRFCFYSILFCSNAKLFLFLLCTIIPQDMCDGKDFRIKQCTVVNQRNFITAHHEMGHIQYFISYKNQPLIFRDGANPGFHEAIGDVMALSVSTPTHLKKVKIIGSTYV